MTGRDGKKYAVRPQAPKPASKPAPEEPASWVDVSQHLDRLAEMIERTGLIPEEMKPWSLVESLETAGRTLLRRAHELRRRHKL